MVSFAYRNVKVKARNSEVTSHLKERDFNFDKFCTSWLINVLKKRG